MKNTDAVVRQTAKLFLAFSALYFYNNIMQNQIAGLPQHQSSQRHCKVLDTPVISGKMLTAHSSQLTAHSIISFYISPTQNRSDSRHSAASIPHTVKKYISVKNSFIYRQSFAIFSSNAWLQYHILRTIFQYLSREQSINIASERFLSRISKNLSEFLKILKISIYFLEER